MLAKQLVCWPASVRAKPVVYGVSAPGRCWFRKRGRVVQGFAAAANPFVRPLNLKSWSRRPRVVCSSGGPALLVESPVLAATLGAAFKLLLLCGLVGNLTQKGVLPFDTSSLLSKVAFNLVVPSMLFSRVAATLVATGDLGLLVLPLVAAIQVLLGTGLGMLVSELIPGDSPAAARWRYGWHPRQPARSAECIAAATAAATGVPAAAAALTGGTKRPGLDSALKDLVIVACGFGNSLSLPLVFLGALFMPQAAARAIGYTALIQVAWYPLVWSLGYKLLTRHHNDSAARQLRPRQQLSDPAHATTGVQLALVNRLGTQVPTAQRQLPGSFFSRRTRHSLLLGVANLRKLMNPPLVGVVSGVLLGISPLGPLLFPAGSAAAAAGPPAGAAALPIELRVMLGLLRWVVEVFEILGSGSVALQSIVLASSLFNAGRGQEAAEAVAPPSSAAPQQVAVAQAVPQVVGAAVGRGPAVPQQTVRRLPDDDVVAEPLPAPACPAPLGSLLSSWLLLPAKRSERWMLAAIAAVRFFCMPLVGMVLLRMVQSLGLLPLDPLCAFALMLQVTMPPAQSLTLMMSLNPSSRHLAPITAQLLLRLYALAILPLTLWVTLFMSSCNIPITLTLGAV